MGLQRGARTTNTSSGTGNDLASYQTGKTPASPPPAGRRCVRASTIPPALRATGCGARVPDAVQPRRADFRGAVWYRRLHVGARHRERAPHLWRPWPVGVAGSDYPEFLPGLRLAGFVEDAGWLSNNNPNGTSKPSSDRLAGLGLGLRYGNGPVSITADYGRLVRGSNVPLTINTGSPQKGDEKLYLNMSVRF